MPGNKFEKKAHLKFDTRWDIEGSALDFARMVRRGEMTRAKAEEALSMGEEHLACLFKEYPGQRQELERHCARREESLKIFRRAIEDDGFFKELEAGKVRSKEFWKMQRPGLRFEDEFSAPVELVRAAMKREQREGEPAWSLLLGLRLRLDKERAAGMPAVIREAVTLVEKGWQSASLADEIAGQVVEFRASPATKLCLKLTAVDLRGLRLESFAGEPWLRFEIVAPLNRETAGWAEEALRERGGQCWAKFSQMQKSLAL